MNIYKKRMMNMSFEQMKKNKKSQIFVCVSIMLSILVLIFVFNVYNSLDMDKYIAKFVKTDFTIASRDYYDMVYDENSKKVEKECIADIEQQVGFKEGGAIYYYTNREMSLIDTETDGEMIQEGLYNNEGRAYLDLYGADKFVIDNMEVHDGTIDHELLQTGKYILYGVDTDDYGNVENQSYNVGDTVTIYVDGLKKEYEIMAIIKKESEINTVKYWSKLYTMYLPSNEYQNVTNDEGAMSYLFNVEDGALETMEAYLGGYVEENSEFQYASKKIYTAEFTDMQLMVKIVGVFLTIVIGMIGIANFCNIIITSIINRKKELAIMQAIGTTKEQIYFMLITEGLAYSVISLVGAIVIGSLFSITILRLIINSIWFFSFKFSLMPVAVMGPIIIMVTFIVPIIVYKAMSKNSIVERIKSTY